MSRGSYYVNEHIKSTGSTDKSYRSCICALIIFIALCLLIIVLCYFLIPLMMSLSSPTSHNARGIYASHEGGVPIKPSTVSPEGTIPKKVTYTLERQTTRGVHTSKQIFTRPITSSPTVQPNAIYSGKNDSATQVETDSSSATTKVYQDDSDSRTTRGGRINTQTFTRPITSSPTLKPNAIYSGKDDSATQEGTDNSSATTNVDQDDSDNRTTRGGRINTQTFTRSINPSSTIEPMSIYIGKDDSATQEGTDNSSTTTNVDQDDSDRRTTRGGRTNTETFTWPITSSPTVQPNAIYSGKDDSATQEGMENSSTTTKVDQDDFDSRTIRGGRINRQTFTWSITPSSTIEPTSIYSGKDDNATQEGTDNSSTTTNVDQDDSDRRTNTDTLSFSRPNSESTLIFGQNSATRGTVSSSDSSSDIYDDYFSQMLSADSSTKDTFSEPTMTAPSFRSTSSSNNEDDLTTKIDSSSWNVDTDSDRWIEFSYKQSVTLTRSEEPKIEQSSTLDEIDNYATEEGNTDSFTKKIDTSTEKWPLLDNEDSGNGINESTVPPFGAVTTSSKENEVNDWTAEVSQHFLNTEKSAANTEKPATDFNIQLKHSTIMTNPSTANNILQSLTVTERTIISIDKFYSASKESELVVGNQGVFDAVPKTIPFYNTEESISTFDSERQLSTENTFGVDKEMRLGMSLLTTATERGLNSSKVIQEHQNITLSPMPDGLASFVNSETGTVPPRLEVGCNSNQAEKVKVCDTSDCKTSASRMLSLMDHNADPCDDFFQFSCGNPMKNFVMDPLMATADIDTIILEKIKSTGWNDTESHKMLKQYYDSCINYYEKSSKQERIEKARDIFGNIFSLKSSAMSLTQLIVKLILYGSSFLFDIGMDINSKNSSMYDVVLRSPEINPLFTSYNFKKEDCLQLFKSIDKSSIDINHYYNEFKGCMHDYTEYIDSIQTAITELGFLDKILPKKAIWVIQNIRVTVEWVILSSLKKLPSKSHQAVSFGLKDAKEMSIAMLQHMFPLIQWESLLRGLFHYGINSETVVQVYFEKGFKEMFNLLQQHKEEDLKIALRAMFAENIYREIVMEKKCNTESYCLKITKYLIPDITSSIYLSTFIRSELNSIEKQILELKRELTEIMTEEVMKDEWYSEYSKSQIYSKLNTLLIPLPTTLDESIIKDSLTEFPLENDYFVNTFQMMKRLKYLKFSLLDRNPQNPRVLWYNHLLPYSESEAYIHGVNAILIPLTVSKILITEEIPSEIAKKTMRQIIGRGIGHALDITGIMYQSHKKNHLLLDDDMLSFSENVNMIGAEIYNKNMSILIKSKNYTFKLEPNLSMNTRMADITAAKLVYLLISRPNAGELPYLWGGFSIEQTYFITLSQMFCFRNPLVEYTLMMFEQLDLPPVLRVVNIATSSHEFSKAFNCSLGSKMNPEIKFVQYPWTD